MFGSWWQAWVHGSSKGGTQAKRPNGSRKSSSALAVERLEDRTVPTVVGDPNQRFVAEVYLNLLDRPADNAGLTYWTGQLDQGAVTPSQMVLDIENTGEYQTVLVQSMFEHLLNRAPDSDALTYFTGELASGMKVEQLENQIFGSQEYFQVRGGSTDAGFLTALYGDVLQRGLDPAAQTYYVQLMAVGTAQYTIANDILTSAEAKQTLVTNIYEQFLNRAPNSAELSAAITSFQAGMPDQALIAELAGSIDAYDVATSLGTNTAVGASATQTVLGQPVTLAAVVTPVAAAAGTPTGAVTFMDGGVAIATRTIDSTGQATFVISSLTEGSHSITANYQGDGTFEASSAAPLVLTVGAPPA